MEIPVISLLEWFPLAHTMIPKSCIHKVQKNALSLQNNMLHS